MQPELISSPLPARSRLYSLPPCGLGTAFTESLTGYVARLAAAHRIRTGTLVQLEVNPGLGQAKRASKVSLTPTYLRSMNGQDLIASTWVQVLGDLTCRHDLRYLTMLPWAEVLSSRGLLRNHRAWCPLCLEEDVEVYERLLWSLAPVLICPRHERPLETKCPHCHLQMPTITWRTVPGFCSRCRGWLGVLPQGYQENSFSPTRMTAWDLKTARDLGALLAVAPSLKSEPKSERITWALVALTGVTDAGSLARKLDVDYITAWTWSKGGVRLLVAKMLSICARFGTSIAGFLTDEALEAGPPCDVLPPPPEPKIGVENSSSACRLEPAMSKDSAGSIKTPRPPRLERYSLYMWAGKYLREVIRADASPPLSLNDVCRLTCLGKPYLYRHYPELCFTISARWKANRQRRGENRRARLMEEVRKTAVRLYDEGVDPTTLNVARRLKQPGAIRDQAAQAALERTRAGLGLDGRVD